jgi:hypothetical protein
MKEAFCDWKANEYVLVYAKRIKHRGRQAARTNFLLMRGLGGLCGEVHDDRPITPPQ